MSRWIQFGLTVITVLTVIVIFVLPAFDLMPTAMRAWQAAQLIALQALLVNPYGAEGVASALYRAFRMSGREQRIRMHRMRLWLRRHDVFQWRKSFCAQAPGGRVLRMSKAPVLSFPRP